MLLRALALGLGVVELLRPKEFTDFWLKLVTKGDTEARAWVYPIVRLEGLVFVLWALTRGRGDSS
ncbi:hypothetical protein [Halogeometricum limi]|uniref:Uncharacterized protein n=1 Tax=Halogeometricum limi TaxID=555875 RepID=A0A1I6HKB1_9EURY|nr:hypothetical protein [Halogeometricum limi]SFR54882.1 hypothetical protein SAMN04488124_2337 [Halogeometricum limi]